MASEDQDILAKISQLAGQINRHKNGQQSDQQTQFIPQARTSSRGSKGLFDKRNTQVANRTQDFSQTSTSWRPGRGGYPSRGYSRGGRAPQVHRNRTLVLNGSTRSTAENADPTSIDDENDNPSAKTTPAWVTKTDRHLQLINTSIFEKDSQNRAKAMEETRKQKLKQRDLRERAKFSKHLQHLGGNNTVASGAPSRSTNVAGNYEINVQGIGFRVAKNGSKLVKVPGEDPQTAGRAPLSVLRLDSRDSGDLNAAKSTPKTALVGGVRFYRSKNGNMYRSGIIKAHRYGRPSVDMATMPSYDYESADIFPHRRSGVVKKINEPCKAFTTTGSCSKGPRCRYVHDPSKVAVCKEFLHKGSCPSGDSCDLSHDLTPERTPTCLHFAKGNCSNPNCRYAHVRVSPTAPVCRPFGIYGYCEKGTSCQDRHIHECPDFSNTGVCTTKGCKLPHRYKASVMRINTARGDASAEDESSDLSSDDDEEEIDSDDVDSDDFDEEYFGDSDGKTDSDIPMQQDFVQLP